MARFRAILFDNGETLFHKPSAPSALAGLASSLGRPIDEQTPVEAWQAVNAQARTVSDALAHGCNRSAAGHRAYYMACYAPLEEIVPGLAKAFYRDIATSLRSMIPYPDTAPTLRALHEAGLALGIVANGYDIRAGYEIAGLAELIGAWVLSFEHGMAKPEKGMWETACRALGVQPAAVLMVGNEPLGRQWRRRVRLHLPDPPRRRAGYSARPGGRAELGWYRQPRRLGGLRRRRNHGSCHHPGGAGVSAARLAL